MEVNINNQVGLDAILSVKIQESDYKEEFDKSLKDYGRKMNVPGFRPGKVPNGVIQKLIGKDARHETVEKVLQKGINEYIESNKIKMVLSPISTNKPEDIDWQKTDFEFKYDIGLKPEVNLNLKPLNSLTKYVVNVSLDEVKKDVDEFRRRSAGVEYAEAYQNTEDFYVYMKFTELDDSGQPLEGGLDKTKNFFNNNIPKKLAELIDGKTTGFETTVKIADIFSEDEMAATFEIDKLSIKDLFPDFKVSLMAVLKLNLPELNQEFFNREFPDGSVTTLDEFYDRWKTMMESHLATQSNNILAGEVKKSLLKDSKMDMPEGFIKKYFDMWAEENPKEAKPENYDKDLESFKEDVKWQILSEQVAEQQSIEVKEEEVVHYAEGLIYNALYRSNPQDITREQLQQYTNNYLTKDNNYNSSAATVRDGKVFDWLISQMDPKTKSVDTVQFEEIKSNSQLTQN